MSEDKITLKDIMQVVSGTVFAFGLGMFSAHNAAPTYDASNNRLNAKICSIKDNGKSFSGRRDANFIVTTEKGDTAYVLQNDFSGTRGNIETFLDQYNAHMSADSSYKNVIFYGKFETDISKVKYSVNPSGNIVPKRTFNADYIQTLDGKMYPIMK